MYSVLCNNLSQSTLTTNNIYVFDLQMNMIEMKDKFGYLISIVQSTLLWRL